MQVRRIERDDLNSHYLNLSSQLSPLPDDSRNVNFGKIWSTFINNNNHHVIVAVQKILDSPKSSNLVVGTGSLLIERKLTGMIAGRIEDVVILREYRKLGIGAAIITSLIDTAIQEECYKITLSCSDKNVPFYGKIGFSKIDNGMKLVL